MNDWRIDQLQLRLPPGYEPRARAIGEALGDALGDALGRLDARPGGTVAALQLTPLRVDPAASDVEIARAVAGAIAAGLEG
ncbi:MAG: hypothetical protein U1F50_12285 [Rubrivivax sp.]